MDIKQLRALLTIAETGSVTRASELLRIVQPAVSRQLRLLEDELGTQLFVRGRNGMEPTEAGTVLIDRVRRALQELDRARDEIRPAAGTLRGLVTVGLLPSVSDHLAAPLVMGLKARHPELQISIAVGYAGHLQQWIESADIDVALLYDVRHSSTLEVQPLLDERLYLVGPTEAGLRMDTPISVQEVACRPLVLPASPHGIRILFERACATIDPKLRIVAQTNAMNVQKNLVMQGLGFTVLPGVSIWEDVTQGRLCAAPIVEPDLRRRIVLARSLGRRSTPQVRALLDELREQVKISVERGLWPDADWLAD